MQVLSKFPTEILGAPILPAHELRQLEVYFESLPHGGGQPRVWRPRRLRPETASAAARPTRSMMSLGARLDGEIRRRIRVHRPALANLPLLSAARFFGPSATCSERREVTESWHVDKEHFLDEAWTDFVHEEADIVRRAEFHLVLVDRPDARGTEFATDESGQILVSEERNQHRLPPPLHRVAGPLGRLHERMLGEVHRAPDGEDSRLCIYYFAVPPSVAKFLEPG